MERGPSPFLRPEDPDLSKPAGCFVTLRKKDELRGCVGVLKSDRPLYQEVIEMTQKAASEDFRFEPIRSVELDEMEIEISILSPLERVSSHREIEIGRHGIFLEWKQRTGAFLPEVATEMGWTAEEFVKSCAREKAHLPESVWPEVSLYRFTTEKIKEKEKKH